MARRTGPYVTCAARAENRPSRLGDINGMNLAGKPGIVQAMQMPPTLGQPPTPPVHPRIGTLHIATGPLHPSLTRHPRASAGVRANSPRSAEPDPPHALL